MRSPHQFNIHHEIEQHSIFRLFPPRAREALIAAAFIKHYRRGQKVMDANEDPPHLIIVLTGIIFVELAYPDGRKLTSPTWDQHGDMLALIQIFTGTPIPWDFVARTQTSLILIPKQVILNILAKLPQLMAPFMNVLCERLHGMAVQNSHALIQRPRERLIHLLLNLAERYGSITAEGTLIDLRISQDEMSFMLSLSRQSINKELKGLSEQGLIQHAYGTITILQIEALKTLVQKIPYPLMQQSGLGKSTPLLQAAGIEIPVLPQAFNP
ncbi:Crp/Fnr family transcriptional regulator [Methylobacillus methanolivorans]